MKKFLSSSFQIGQSTYDFHNFYDHFFGLLPYSQLLQLRIQIRGYYLML